MSLFSKALFGVIDRAFAGIFRTAREDRGLRDALRDLHARLGEELEELAPEESVPAQGGQADVVAESEPNPVEYESVMLSMGGKSIPVDATVRVGEEVPRVKLKEVEIAANLTAVRVPAGSSSLTHRRADLAHLQRCARLMQELCRHAKRVRECGSDGVDRESLRETGRGLVARCKQDRGLEAWPLDPERADLGVEQLILAAECYENVRIAASIAGRWEIGADPEDSPDEETLTLAAEAQSALLAQMEALAAGGDSCQAELYGWIRGMCHEHQIYVARYMSLQDQADPGEWFSLRERLQHLEDEAVGADERARSTRKAIAKVSYHVDRIRQGRGCEGGREWSALDSALDQAIKVGLYASNTELCDLMLNLPENSPESFPQSSGAELVQREMKLREKNRCGAPAPSTKERPEGEELLRARALVKGKTLLMIGGEARADAVRSLEEKLRFKEVVWKETHAHRPIEPLQLEISKDEIDIVAVLVRFGDHAFSTLRKTANRHGKVFLHLPAGYNPNQVAHQIIEQADRQLSS
jgi:hypothetical protein